MHDSISFLQVSRYSGFNLADFAAPSARITGDEHPHLHTHAFALFDKICLHLASWTALSSVFQVLVKTEVSNSWMTQDPAGIGFVPWRIAFYVVGTLQDLQNALTLLDDFVTFRKENTFEHELPFPTLSFQIHTEESIAAALNTAALEHEVTLLKPHRFDPFDAAPPAGLKVLVFSAEFDADGWHLSGVFLGQTYPFKDRFEAAGVYGAREEGTDTYVRVLAKTDVGNETGRTWFFDALLKEILHNIVMQVRLTTSPPEGSPAAQFLGLLVDLPQISLKQGA